MGNWGYFTISGVMHPVGAYFVGMGLFFMEFIVG